MFRAARVRRQLVKYCLVLDRVSFVNVQDRLELVASHFTEAAIRHAKITARLIRIIVLRCPKVGAATRLPLELSFFLLARVLSANTIHGVFVNHLVDLERERIKRFLQAAAWSVAVIFYHH